MELQSILFILVPVLLLCAYLYHINQAISTTPEEVERVAAKPWTKELLQEAYEKCRKERPDFKKYLPPKQIRRYIVFGGSGKC